MKNFTFHNPVEVVFGDGAIEKLSVLVPRDKKILITYGGGSIKRNGIYDQVIATLPKRKLYEFGGIEANPEFETLCKAADFCRSNQIGFILAVGGGSVIDGSKFIASAAKYAGDPWDFLSRKAKPSFTLPLGCVLTLPATGSEMNGNAVISRREIKQKNSFGSSKLLPQFAILEPATTKTLPVPQRINGVIDAFAHVMEQYLTYPAGAFISDNLAEGILRTLTDLGKTYVENPDNLDIAGNIMWASSLALNGLISCGVTSDWSTHGIGHILTAYYEIDHAITLAIVLPGVMDVMRENKKEKLLQYADRIWGITKGSEDDRINQAIEKTESFFRGLGAKTKISEFAIQEDVPHRVAEALKNQDSLPLGEHQDMDYDTIVKILQSRV
ncbi:MAG: iron-containing alcohol dehydrogenase [Bacteroidales bacterium]|nr:iron-containing alcohol dehydrogenase [Bacteroidales bacterium]MDD2322735.1 iron-containing alcohol dehydrogenase [Bacteroidales bacterium]MDD3010129.1 iron-containing alcohol dehydrogenase [Bacteroidales bacterium]MDY0286843.1 iron-containing alcohol dehydrogenase [Bacteroidales bacterium]HPE87204.1 iron-containing alcohol dehydrogenase [Bacteroidales bacterium]